MNGSRGRTIATALTLTVAACGLRDVAGPPGAEQIVVQGVLSTGVTEQVLWIERITPAGEPLTGAPRPLLVPPERVEVRDSTGAVFSFQQDPANAARFVASFTPVHRRRYELVVEAGDDVVRGVAVIPAPLAIVDPASDTILIGAGSALRVTWASGSSPWIAIFALDPKTGQTYGPILVSDDTSYQFPGPFLLDTTVVSVLAVDSLTARLIVPFLGGDPGRTLDGNLTGGAGFLGAASGDRLVVRKQ